MKKILFLLLSMYNLSYAVQYLPCNLGITNATPEEINSLHYTAESFTFVYDGYYYQVSPNGYLGNIGCGVCTSSTPAFGTTSEGTHFIIVAGIYNGFDSRIVSQLGPYTPPLTCDPATQDLVNGQCVCKSGYVDDGQGDGGCVYDCSANIPIANVVPLGWQSYVDTYTQIECEVTANQFFYKQYNYTELTPDTNHPECVHSICDVNEFSSDPCNNADSPNVPNGYILSGTVNKELECNSKVDGVNYLNYQIQLVHPNCQSEQDSYCFLMPNLDNPNQGVSLPEQNQTNPDGTIPNDYIPPIMDINDTINNSNDSLNKTNALLGQLSLDLKNLINGNTVINNSNTVNNNSNTNNIVTAINESKTDTSGIENRLDTLIGTSTIDLSSDTISSMSDIASSLTDINLSLPTSDINDSMFDINFNDIKDMSMLAYDGYETKAQNSLTAVFDSIDYGVSDIFNIPNTDFVDYFISVPLPMTSKNLEGNLMSAEFLNSLDFSLARLALMIATLLMSIFYVIDRLFR